MINILSVKVGDAYSSAHVNRLFKYCLKYYNKPFQMYCYTDDSSNFDSEIIPIQLVTDEIVIPTHNKLALFSSQISNKLKNEKCIYFDLDIVMTSNVSFMEQFIDHGVTTINPIWRLFDDTRSIPQATLNSSVMVWNKNEVSSIWEKYKLNINKFQYVYMNGMDSFLSKECSDMVTNKFPLGLFYCHQYGVDGRLNQLKGTNSFSVYKDLIDNACFILFNGGYNDKTESMNRFDRTFLR